MMKRKNIGKKVLVVDDNELLVDAIMMILEKAGYITKGVTSGSKAIEEMEKNRYDLLITDIEMPVMNGFKVIKRCEETHKGLPVIIITADRNMYNLQIEKALKKNVISCISKPFNVWEFIETVNSVF